MSTLTVTTLNTANGTTDQTHTTGNTSAGKMIISSNGSGIALAGNSTTNNIIITPTAVTFSTNTLNLGTSTISSNGYTFLPNGIKLNFGSVSSNATVGDITFTSAFTTLYSITVSSVNSGASSTYVPFLIASNTTTANVRTSNATATTCYYMALGN